MPHGLVIAFVHFPPEWRKLKTLCTIISLLRSEFQNRDSFNLYVYVIIAVIKRNALDFKLIQLF